MNRQQLYGITADSIPDRDGGFFNSGWDCNQWMTWHKELVKVFGRKKANDMFVLEFDKQSSLDTQYNFCKYNSDFTNYFKSQGLNAGHLLSNAINNSVTIVENLSDGLVSTSKTLKTFVPILLAVIGIGGTYYVYKNYIKGNKKIKIAGVTV